MVHKIIQTKQGIFLESLVITALILLIGISIGTAVENNRTEKIVESYKNYEIEALDLKLQNYYYQIMSDQTCDEAIEQNFKFADDIYLRGIELEKFEETNQLSEDLGIEKRKYTLLKTELWLNSILLKQKCNRPFDTLVYLYSSDPDSSAKVAEQKVISDTLKELKEKKLNNVILLPIAGDLSALREDESSRLGAIELQKRIYNITYLPSLIINEETVLEGYRPLEEIESYLSN